MFKKEGERVRERKRTKERKRKKGREGEGRNSIYIIKRLENLYEKVQKSNLCRMFTNSCKSGDLRSASAEALPSQNAITCCGDWAQACINPANKAADVYGTD